MLLLRCIISCSRAISRYTIGLPGICALGLGYHVSFSDYNAVVLQKLTSINVALNNTTTTTTVNSTTTNSSSTTNATYYDIRNISRYYAGDWISVSNRLLLGQRYPLILTAETLYTLDTCKKVSIYLVILYIPPYMFSPYIMYTCLFVYVCIL